MNHPTPSPRRPAFSLVEMLIALTITATLLTAALAALDASFKSYRFTTESASTHVVSRIVMNRIMGLIRTGTSFGVPPIEFDGNGLALEDRTDIEFTVRADPDSLDSTVFRLEARPTTDPDNGPNELWLVQQNYTNGTLVDSEERLLLRGLIHAQFILEWSETAGPGVVRATVDLIIRPNDYRDATLHTSTAANPNPIRMVSSADPRPLQEPQ